MLEGEGEVGVERHVVLRAEGRGGDEGRDHGEAVEAPAVLDLVERAVPR